MSDQNKICGSPGTDAPPCGSRDVASVEATAALTSYDAGLLSDFGGGNVEWYQDYIRAQLGAAHDYYQAQVDDMRLAVAWAKTFGAAHDAMQDALTAITRHADNQDIGHVDFRMHAKQQADFTLEQCAGSPGMLDPAPTPKPDWADGQWKWADEERLLTKISDQARRYAGFYPEASDGRNTFILFAEWIERLGTGATPRAAITPTPDTLNPENDGGAS